MEKAVVIVAVVVALGGMVVVAEALAEALVESRVVALEVAWSTMT